MQHLNKVFFNHSTGVVIPVVLKLLSSKCLVSRYHEVVQFLMPGSRKWLLTCSGKICNPWCAEVVEVIMPIVLKY